MRKKYEEGNERRSEERAVLDVLWKEANQDSGRGRSGYAGSYVNCVFSILYEVFGMDVIAFLFDHPWVPDVTIEAFQPKHFLSRLAVLEAAASKLRNGDTIPVLLPETVPYRHSSESQTSLFVNERYRFFLDHSLRELREFGELGYAVQSTGRRMKVSIHIWAPYGYDPGILPFVTPARREEIRKRIEDDN